MGIGIGDLGLAWQCLRIAVALDPGHCEAATNLGVLEMRKGADEQARAYFRGAQKAGSHAFEPFFNGALLAFKAGDFQEAAELVGGGMVGWRYYFVLKNFVLKMLSCLSWWVQCLEVVI